MWSLDKLISVPHNLYNMFIFNQDLTDLAASSVLPHNTVVS